MNKFPLLICLLLSACATDVKTVKPGRGPAALERGPEAKVYPAHQAPHVTRHGLWQGLDEAGKRRWELRYTRGLPSGPYREWDSQGRMTATWSYNWQGQLEGWARWFENGKPVYKRELTPDTQPGFDPVGYAAALREWAEALPVKK
jgi:hypothetical protein